MLKHSSDILFTRDLIKRVSSSLGVRDKKVEYVYYSIVSYLHRLLKKTEFAAIFIPFIGTLHAKRYYVVKRLKRNMYKDEAERTILQKRLESIDNHRHDLYEKKYKGLSRHQQINMLEMDYHTDGLTIEEIEKKQNGQSI